jgi:hypothetical protein
MGLRLYFKINSVVMFGRDKSGFSDGSEGMRDDIGAKIGFQIYEQNAKKVCLNFEKEITMALYVTF